MERIAEFVFYGTIKTMKKTVIAVCVATIFFAFAGCVLAQSYVPLAPLPGTLVAGTNTTNLSTYLAGAIKLLVALGAALAVLFAIIGGTQYVAASINPSAKKDAMERIQRALLGLGIILASYLLLNSINPKLVQFNFMLPAIGTLPGAQTIATSGEGVHVPLPLATNPLIQAGTSAVNSVFQPITSTSTLADANAQAQQSLNARIDRTNDYSIISHCPGNTTYDLCPKTDLNHDGKTNTTDLMLFITKGNTFNVNQNRTLELANASPAVATSCFFKTSTANINAMLPRARIQNENGNGFGGFGLFGNSPCSGNSVTLAPTLECNGATWLKFPVLGGACAVDNGLLNMPFGFVYLANGTSPGAGGADGQYSNFKIWVTGASSGSAVNLTSLFVKTFLKHPTPFCSESCPPYDPYLESNLGKITYTTIAQYDLNDDGVADFSAGGADMTAFNACKGPAVSGACAQADFNGDGTIDDRDLGFVKFVQRDIFGGSGAIPLGGKLNWFESMMFDPAGYTDKQIINYCLGRTAFEKCGFADVNGDRIVNNADITAFDTGATLLDFNSDGVVNLQ